MFENAFKDKVVIVTGGSRGIGFACVKGFLAAGAKVCFLSHYEETGAKALAELKAINPDYEVYNKVIELHDYKAAQDLFAEVEKKWGRIDVLCNNAGMDCSIPVKLIKQSQWDEVMTLNLKAVFNLSKYAISYLKKTKGCIVNTASVAGVYGSPMGTPYPASKAGVIGVTKSLAWTYAPLGVRVNAVAPGVVDTDMVAATPEVAKKTISGTIPLKRFGQPEDIANAIMFLASDSASYITGVTLQVDGGYRPANVY
jgi:3-oxoacyl-[acyl-carrier protein] reductase/7-alpha-hydroxysteroid dehydrogenase